MGTSETGRATLRVERGAAGEEELAAVALVLCSVLAARREQVPADREPPPAPSWRPERAAAVYRSPHSW
jgi:hypothetical protein